MDSKYLACPTEIHDELKSDHHRLLTETVPVGAQTYKGAVLVYLRNCLTCKSTLGLEYDVDALPLANDAAGHAREEASTIVEELPRPVLDVAVTQI